MKPTPISADQRKRLQVLYQQLCARDLSLDKSRECRLRWAAELVNRAVDSYSNLTKSEGTHLITCAQQQLGIAETDSAAGYTRKSWQDRQRAGKDGRHDGAEFDAQPQIVSAAELDKIQRLMLKLRWNQAVYEKWLQSGRSPLRKHKTREVRTVAHANAVIWGLRGMLREQGVSA